MSTNLQNALRDHFGFDRFRSGQSETIKHVLAKRNTLVVMPTGAGKSLCYQLPAVLAEGTTLVVSPLIALMKDQVEFLQSKHIAATFINSSLPPDEQQRRLRDMREERFRLVYVAPERFRSQHFGAVISTMAIALFVVDEAHCISHWGHDFRPDYLGLREAVKGLGKPTVMALTATATVQVQEDIVKQLDLQDCKRVVTGFNRPNLSFEVQHVADDTAKYGALEKLIKGQRSSKIIYAGTRQQSEEVAAFARLACKRKADYYHAGLDANQRSRIQESFMSDETNLIVCTNAFGMGVDKPNIRYVIHWNLPGTLEAYYQEAGRAGRDGKFSRCVLFYAAPDRGLQEWFIENDAPTKEEFEDLFDRLAGLADNGNVRTTVSYLRNLLGVHETKVRVGLAELVRVGALKDQGDQNAMRYFRLSSPRRPDFGKLMQKIYTRRKHRHAQLQQMVNYAEQDRCRRRFILEHFGDPSKATAEFCCDICNPPDKAALTRPSENYAYSEIEKAALIILHTIKHLGRTVGRARLVEVLTGSKAKDIVKYGWHRVKHYGRLQQFKQQTCREFIDELLKMGYLRLQGSDYPVLKLTPKGDEALRLRAAIRLLGQAPPTPAPANSPLTQISGLTPTLQATLSCFREGLGVDEISQKRQLSQGTVYQHLAMLIAADLVKVTAIIPPERVQAIQKAILKTGQTQLRSIKDVLPETFSYDEIRCVVADNQRRNLRDSEAARPGQNTMDSRLFDKLREYRLHLSKQLNLPPFVFFHDSVLRELASTKPASLEELYLVKGLGAAKISRYGQDLLDIVGSRKRKKPTFVNNNYPNQI